MNLKEIGEFGFIESFKPLFNNLLKQNQIGIGDDCAILSANEDEDWLITTDLLVEDVHFLRNAILPEQLGHKSLAVNLSDIAAMGGTPLGSFLSIAIPSDIEVEYLNKFMNGYYQLSSKYSTPLLGGDTTKSLKHLTINVCVIGKCKKGKAKRRNSAKTGDIVCVSGNLGDSAGGLNLLLNKTFNTSDFHAFLLKKHHEPEPRLKEGLFFSEYKEVHAMMDISDGIASDLKHILKASDVSAKIQLDKLPISNELIQTSKDFEWNCTELAAAGGEDYELLLTIEKDSFNKIQNDFQKEFNKPLYKIGEISAGIPEILWEYENNPVNFMQKGFNHF